MKSVEFMRDSFLQYLKFEKRYSSHTLSAYENDLTQLSDFIADQYQSNEIATADYQFIRSWVVSLVEQKMNPLTINRKIATLRTFYKFLQRKQVISNNPMLKIKALKTAKNIPHFVEENAINNILDHTAFPDGFEGARDKLIIELFYGTGIRLSELINIKVGDINFYEKNVKVTGKRDKQRIVPLHNNLVSSILNYKIEKQKEFKVFDDFMIVNDKGEKCMPIFVYRIVRKYLSASTTGKRSPHVLRHTFATHLLNHGADLNAIKDLLGHTSLAATQVYTHNSLDKLKKIFDQAHPKA